ncbi:hypothetical protein Tco_1552718 [Tanacetum coccineum]
MKIAAAVDVLMKTETTVADVELHPPPIDGEDDAFIVISSDDEDDDVIVISSDDEDDDYIVISSDDEDVVAPTLVQPHVLVLAKKRVFSLIDKPDSDEECWTNAFVF